MDINNSDQWDNKRESRRFFLMGAFSALIILLSSPQKSLAQPFRRRRFFRRYWGRRGAGRFGPADGELGTDNAPSQDDHLEAREALQRGEAEPLQELLKELQKRVKGEILDFDFMRVGFRFVYLVKVLLSDGRIDHFFILAQTREIYTLEEARQKYEKDFPWIFEDLEAEGLIPSRKTKTEQPANKTTPRQNGTPK